MRRVLVVYASRYGSTAEVAEAIGKKLRLAGHDVDVLPARDVASPIGYEAIVVGGSLYMGRWHSDACRFLERNRDALASLPLGVFALGPGSPEDAGSSRRQLHRALERARVEPDTVAIVGGVIDPAKLCFPFSRMAQIDLRDWDAIGAWARELSELFEKGLATAAL